MWRVREREVLHKQLYCWPTSGCGPYMLKYHTMRGDDRKHATLNVCYLGDTTPRLAVSREAAVACICCATCVILERRRSTGTSVCYQGIQCNFYTRVVWPRCTFRMVQRRPSRSRANAPDEGGVGPSNRALPALHHPRAHSQLHLVVPANEVVPYRLVGSPFVILEEFLAVGLPPLKW